MREIKFRAKAKDWKKYDKWIYGSYFISDKVGCMIPEKVSTTHWIMHQGSFYFSDRIEIDIETLSQFTGLKDKNGKEIYEGDIVRKLLWQGRKLVYVGTFEPFEVKWLGTGFNVKDGKHKYEVIGNIYKNQELNIGGTNGRD